MPYDDAAERVSVPPEATREPEYTICPDCGADLEWHQCQSGE